MKKIAIMGANSFQNPLILKAKEMGLETHVFAWSDGSIGEKTADYFYPISLTEKDKVLEKCRKINPDAVVTIASDLAAITTQYVAQHLGLNCNSSECMRISTNKYEMRKAFCEAKIPTPKFQIVEQQYNLNPLKDLQFPVIVKPVDRSGSRGIMKVSSFEKLEEAIKISQSYSFEKKAIVEEYLEGEEFSCECISYQGKHYFLALTKKFTSGAPHFIETGHFEPVKLSEHKKEKLKSQIFSALDALKINYGASHSEFKMDNDGNIRIIEIGARMGGDCIGSDLVQISTGYDFVRMVIEIALGQPPSFKQIRTPQCAAIRFVLSNKDLEILEQIKKEAPEIIYDVSTIDSIDSHIVKDSSTRYGYFIVACKDSQIVEKILF